MFRDLLVVLPATLLGTLLMVGPVTARAEVPDGDGDGVADGVDACPKEPGIKSSDPKTSGCAAKVGALALKSSAEVTFSGYQSLPGNRGIVFVELSDAVAVEVSRVGQVIEYRLVGARVPLKNNKNPLLLRDFKSSAMSAVLVPEARGKGRHKSKQQAVRLVIELRGDASPAYRMVQRGRGAVLEVDLPAFSGK